MKQWRIVIVGVTLAGSVHGQEIPDPDEAGALPARQSEVLGRAVADRFVACSQAEGEALTEADRGLLGDAVSPLGAPVAGALGAVDCVENPAAEARCAGVIAAASCEALASALLNAPTMSAPTPAWAQTHARAVVDRVSACLIDERAGLLGSDEEAAALDALNRSLGTTLAVLSAAGRCHIDASAQPACVASLQALACDAMSAHLDEDPGRFLSDVTPECERFLRCNAPAEADGGLEALLAE